MNYQKDNAATEDGLATPALLSSVQANLAARGGTTASAVARASDLSAQQTMALQQLLARRGYYSGSPGGVYDADTQTAVRGYQRARGLRRYRPCGCQPAGDPPGRGPPAGIDVDHKVHRGGAQQEGLSGGPIDGQNDPQTQTAIADFIRQAKIGVSDTPSEPLLNAIKYSSMTAREGARSEMYQSGVKAVTDMFGGQ